VSPFDLALDVTAIGTGAIATFHAIGTGASNAILKLRLRRLQRRLDGTQAELADLRDTTSTLDQHADEAITVSRPAPRRGTPMPPPPARVPSTHRPYVTSTPAPAAKRKPPQHAVATGEMKPVIGDGLQSFHDAVTTTGVMPAILGGELPSEDAGIYDVRTGRQLGWGDVA